MGFIEKLKLLFKVKSVASDISDEVQEVKKTKKWLHFIVTLLGTLLTTASAAAGLLSPMTQLIVVTILQCVYNIVRGADKADSDEIKGTFRTTEFWMSALSEVQKGFVSLQAGGVNPEWMVTSTALIGATLSFGQNLAARTLPPSDPK